MMTTLHDPIPDGRTGPFLRGPRHATSMLTGELAYDPRCHECRMRSALHPLAHAPKPERVRESLREGGDV